MKCPKCGEQIVDDSKFCSYCGEIIEAKQDEETVKETPKTENVQTEPADPKKDSISDKIKRKAKETWKKLSLFGKATTVSLIMFVFCGLVALLAKRVFSVVIAAVAVAIVIVALLMRKQVIKVPKTWIPILIVFLSFLLVIPYVSLFKIHISEFERYDWDEVVLADELPKPKSPYGEISWSSEDYLSLTVEKMTLSKYEKYVKACENKGFTIDAEIDEKYFCAFNDNGYKLILNFLESSEEMHISLKSEMDFEKIEWSDSKIAKKLPVPKSPTGSISVDDDDYFSVYVSDTNIDGYKAYVASCEKKGFTVDANKQDKSYVAKNAEGYKITVDYEGNNVIYISISEPEYDITIDIQCKENAVFSKYNVDVYIDGDFEGTVYHGDKESFDVVLKRGKHIISFENEDDDTLNGEIEVEISKKETIKLKISCSSKGVDVKLLSDNGTKDDVSKETTAKKEETTSKKEETTAKKEETTKPDDKAKIPDDWTNLLEKNYKDVKKKFKNAGFTNIVCNPIEIDFDEEKVSEGSVVNIAIGKDGDVCTFEKGEKWPKDTKIRIDYRVKPAKPAGNLTVENCPELAAILSNKAEIDQSYSLFASKYEGSIIEFDGRIDYCTTHGSYSTRFDYLVSAGNYDPNSQIGPTFKFEDVNYFDLNTDLDTVSVGLNVRIVAKVISFDSNSGIFYLEPVSITSR